MLRHSRVREAMEQCRVGQYGCYPAAARRKDRSFLYLVNFPVPNVTAYGGDGQATVGGGGAGTVYAKSTAQTNAI